MKRLIITLFIAVAALSVKAQTQQPQQQEEPKTVLLPINGVRTAVRQIYQLIATSDIPVSKAGPALQTLQQLDQLLVPMVADTTKKQLPAKPKKTK